MTLNMTDIMSSADTDWFATNVGVSIISIGAVGVILNSFCLVYFSNLKNTATDFSVYTRASFINLAVTDLLMSLCATFLRGPGYVNPSLIWGSDVVASGGYSSWCEGGMFLIWYIQDLNVLGVIPLSFIFLFLYVPFLSLTKLNLLVCIISCWMVPLLEIIVMLVLISYDKLSVKYEDIYRRCTISGEYGEYLTAENSSVFFGFPLFIHVMSWGLIIYYVCRRGNNYQDKQWWKFLKTGVIVIVAFTSTWLPYFVVSWYSIRPTGWFSFVFCFLYASVVINPVIYGMRSMKFNGKTVGDIVKNACIGLRARALTVPADEGAFVEQEGVVSRSYDDIGGEEDMVTNY